MSYRRISSLTFSGPTPVLNSKASSHLLGLGDDKPIVECSAETKATVQSNRIPMWPDRINRWEVVYMGPEITHSQLGRHIERLFSEVWFTNEKKKPVVAGVTMLQAETLEVRVTTQHDIDVNYEGDLNKYLQSQTYGGERIVLWQQKSPFPFSVASNAQMYAFIEVTFHYFGDELWYFNPTFQGMPMGPKMGEWDCPSAVNTFVLRAYDSLPFDACEWAKRYAYRVPDAPPPRVYTSPDTFVTAKSDKCSSQPDPWGGSKTDEEEKTSKGDITPWLIGIALAGVGVYAWKRSKAKKTPSK